MADGAQLVQRHLEIFPLWHNRPLIRL